MFPFCQNHLKLRIMRKKQWHHQNCCSLLMHTPWVVYKGLQTRTGWWVIVRVARCTCVCWMRKKKGRKKKTKCHSLRLPLFAPKLNNCIDQSGDWQWGEKKKGRCTDENKGVEWRFGSNTNRFREKVRDDYWGACLCYHLNANNAAEYEEVLLWG